MVGTTREHQWRASLDGLNPNTRYCYRIYGDGVGLLGHARAPRFRTQVKQGGTAPFSFAVLGDWGAVDASGQNPDQAAVLHQIAQSPARFAVTTGDTAYPSGSQRNYGDLVQRGRDTSGVFGPAFWAQAGSSIAVQRPGQPRPERDRPRELAAITRGVFLARPLPHASVLLREQHGPRAGIQAPGTRSMRAWRASTSCRRPGPTATSARATMYRNDHDVHWRASSAEMHWLRHDLRTHHREVSFAFFHFPLYADTATEGSDPWLHGPGHLEAVLGKHGVDSSSTAMPTSMSATRHLHRGCPSAM